MPGCVSAQFLCIIENKPLTVIFPSPLENEQSYSGTKMFVMHHMMGSDATTCK